MPKFSIITPVHLWNQQRVDWFLRCIKSVEAQTFKDFEWIIINDGSVVKVDLLWKELLEKGFILHHQPHNERVIAYNAALQIAKGDWICLLDSDDEYVPEYLEEVDKMTKKYPKAWMFNFGAIFEHKDGGQAKRDPFMPKKLKKGHEMFGGGNIVKGTFVFHRGVYADLGAFPFEKITNVDGSEINYGGIRDLFMGSPWDFSAAAQIEFPEIRKYFFIDVINEPDKTIKELGNPWGDDYYLFYKYTRKYHSKPIKKHLYKVHPR